MARLLISTATGFTQQMKARLNECILSSKRGFDNFGRMFGGKIKQKQNAMVSLHLFDILVQES